MPNVLGGIFCSVFRILCVVNICLITVKLPILQVVLGLDLTLVDLKNCYALTWDTSHGSQLNCTVVHCVELCNAALY